MLLNLVLILCFEWTLDAFAQSVCNGVDSTSHRTGSVVDEFGGAVDDLTGAFCNSFGRRESSVGYSSKCCVG